MKIDTSKLTPVQAQQIEAIASGKPFELRLSHTAMSLFDGITDHVETPINTERFARMIGITEKQLTDDERTWSETDQQRLENLKREQAGLPVWYCSNQFRSDSLSAASGACFRHETHRDRLWTMATDALVAKFGPTLTLDSSTYWVFGQSVSATFHTWPEAEAWLAAHQALRDGHLKEITAVMDETAAVFLSTAPTIVRLRARYSRHVDDSLKAAFIRSLIVDLPVRLRRWHQTLQASLTKALDILRPKA